MSNRPDFERMKQAWQEEPVVPMPEIADLIQSRTHRIWSLTALDVLATVGVIAFIAYLLSSGASQVDWFFSAFLAVATAAGWAAVLRIRRGTWRLDAESPDAMIDLLVRRCRASIRLAELNLWCLALGMVVGFIFRFWLRPEIDALDWQLEPTERLVLRVLFLMAAGLWALSAEWYRRRKKRELVRLLDLRREFGEAD